MWISKGEYKLFLEVLIGHFLVSECELAERQDAKVEEVGPLVRRSV